MISNNFLFLWRNDRTFALITGNDGLYTFLHVFLNHGFTAAFYRTQRCFINNIGQLSSRGSCSCTRNCIVVHIRTNFNILCMNFQNCLSAFQVGEFHGNTPVKTARTKQRFIETFRPVCSCQNDNTLAAVEAIHFRQQLIQRLLTFIIG